MRKIFLLMVSLLGFPFALMLCSIHVASAADPYVVGFIADITGPSSSFYYPEAEGFRLYIDQLNSQGGINGHPVKLILEDAKSDPAKSAAVAKKMIESDNVVGIFGLGLSSSQLPVFELASKAGIPVVCGYTSAVSTHKVKPGSSIFAMGVVMTPEFHSGGFAFAKVVELNYPKTAKIAVSGYATPGGRMWSTWEKERLQKDGYNVVYESNIPPGTIEFSPWMNAVAKIKPDVYTHAEGGEVLIPLGPALEKVGYTNDLMVPYGVIERDVEKMRAGLMGNGEWITWLTRYAAAYDSDAIPEYGNIKKAMAKFGHQIPLSAMHASGWTMGRLCEAALAKAGWPATGANLIAALEKTNLDARGLTGGPLRFTSTDHHGPSWWRLYRWNDKKKALVSSSAWFKLETSEIVK
jgi:branched-chain amino acid transport system substrate-binding protein